jgi:hypothetical protein
VPEQTIDFGAIPYPEQQVRELVKGAKSPTQVKERLKGYTVKPEPSEVFSVQGAGDGFDILFLIGVGKRPRVIHCTEPEFDDFDLPVTLT